MSTSEPLKPCPNCGESCNLIEGRMAGTDVYYVRCGHCFMTGPSAGLHSQSRMAWNRLPRHGAAPAELEPEPKPDRLVWQARDSCVYMMRDNGTVYCRHPEGDIVEMTREVFDATHIIARFQDVCQRTLVVLDASGTLSRIDRYHHAVDLNAAIAKSKVKPEKVQ